ncbi:MAG: hypothetical protein KGI54_15400 [Pseudomonadota bacterium]|nr:hypothetical protein [Pseudomonadota bacterium]
MISIIKSANKYIVVGSSTANQILIGKSLNNKPILKSIPAGTQINDVFKEITFVKAADERKSPPKGYPEDKREYALPDTYEFPIDREHIHAAISYFSKHNWRETGQKKSAAKRIMAAAKKFGVDVDKDSDVARAARG